MIFDIDAIGNLVENKFLKGVSLINSFLRLFSFCNVTNNACEVTLSVRIKFTDRQINRECCPVRAFSLNFPSDADDFFDPSGSIVFEVLVMLGLIRGGASGL